jgi:hypothetical protein
MRTVTSDLQLTKQITDLQSRLDGAERELAETKRHAAVTSPGSTDGVPRSYANKTVEELWRSICEGRTAMQCKIFMADEKGKWIDTEGKVGYIQPTGQVLLLVGDRNRGVQCIFDDKWKAKLGTFRNSDSIKLAGKIVGYQVGILILQECELRD